MTVHTTDHTTASARLSTGRAVAGSVLLLLVAAFGTNVVLSSVLPITLPLPLLQLLIAAGTVAVALPLTAWAGRRLRPARSLHDRGLRRGRARHADALAGSAIGGAAAALPMGVAVTAGAFTPAVALDGGDLGLLPGIALLVVAMALVATWEELLLRGVLVGELATALRRRISPRWAAALAVVLGAVLFGLGHAGQPDHPALLITWMVAGLVFGSIFVVDGGLALVIGAHAGFNIAHNAVVVRADVQGSDRLSAIVRVEQLSDSWWLLPGGLIELTGFLLVGVFALLWLLGRRGHLRLQLAGTEQAAEPVDGHGPPPDGVQRGTGPR